MAKTVAKDLRFTRVVRTRGNYGASFVFVDDAELEAWKQSDLPRLEQQYGPLTLQTDTLPGLGIGDTCHVIGEGSDTFRIKSLVRYDTHRYGFFLDAGWTEEVAKCIALPRHRLRTHTIRNKASACPILTLSPGFMRKVLDSHPEAFSLALSWFNGQHKRLTGKPVRLCHEQSQTLLARVGATETGMWTSRFAALPPNASRIVSLVEKGLPHMPGLDFESALEVAQELYAMLEKAYPTAPAD